MTWAELIAAWAQVIDAPAPASPAELAGGLRALAQLLDAAGNEFGEGSRPATEAERVEVFALLARVSNGTDPSPFAVAQRVSLALVSVAVLKMLQSAGLFEGL